MRPAGCAFLSGWATISTVTTWPGAAPMSAPGGIRMSWLMRRFSAATKAMPCGLCGRPPPRAFALHRAQPPAEAVDLGRLDMQQLAQGFLVHRYAFLGQGVEYQFAAGQRIFVALGFARKMRIVRAARGGAAAGAHFRMARRARNGLGFRGLLR